MSRRNTIVRSLHDVGLAAWFGGSLMGAVGVNGATREISVREERVPVANEAWGRWQPVAAGAIAAHLIGAVGMLAANRGRVRNQAGVGASSAVKTVLTGASLGVTGYAWLQGHKLDQAGSVSAAGGTVPSGETPPEAANAQQQLRALQWGIPAATGALVVVSALQGEQQRADQSTVGRVRGVARRQQRKLSRAAKATEARAAGAAAKVGAQGAKGYAAVKR